MQRDRVVSSPSLSVVGLLTLCLCVPAGSSAEEIVEIPACTTESRSACLRAPVQVILDREGVPHLIAEDERDLAFVSGYVHARDRFFQMDVTRRQISGDLAELLGPGEIGDDIQGRAFGLRRAAQRTLDEGVLSPALLAVLEAYADGVNFYLEHHPLPPEYALLELTQARPWTVLDTVTMGKGLAANLSLDIDAGPTFALSEFLEAGAAHGFDGEALFFDDVRRSAPMDPASTVPDAGGRPTFAARSTDGEAAPLLLARTAEAARRAHARLEPHPLFAAAMRRREFEVGSNEWGVGADVSVSGRPIIANDPHLALDIPATFYEWRLVVTGRDGSGPMNVSGVSFPGAPGVVLGQNEHVTWGATTTGLDVTDIFEDEFLLFQPDCFLETLSLACIRTEGRLYPVELQFGVKLRANRPNDGILDNVEVVRQETLASVPFRSFGPVVDIAGVDMITGGIGTALVLQYTGFHATRELETFFKWNRAANLDDFLDGLADFDFGAQNWAYADDAGNVAYFSSAEVPLRRDLEAGPIDRKEAPSFIRDGSGPENWVPDPERSQGQSIPYAVIPFDEMPQVVNPPHGFFVNANNDPAGTTLDNDPLNERRLSNPNGVYYLSTGYAIGMRAGRITRLLRDQLEAGRKISPEDMKRFQGNTQQLDAEILTPFLVRAFENAQSPGAPSQLAALASDPGVAEAIGRLGAWDFSTPTGIPEGWDASDPPARRRGAVPRNERTASVAATIYNVWRGKLIRSTVDRTLAGFGLDTGSSDALKAVVHLLSQDPFTGVGASGVDFFPEPAALPAEARRDLALLSALGETLETLASDEFAPAFARSANQDDYRWGRLHRIRFDHRFEPSFDVPPAGGFEDLAPDLPGIPRDGGYNVVNASGFSARADSLNGFMFGGGPVRRYVGIAGLPAVRGSAGRVRGFNVVPGGPSGDPSSPLYANQMATWLTADQHPVTMDANTASRAALRKERFVPAR